LKFGWMKAKNKNQGRRYFMSPKVIWMLLLVVFLGLSPLSAQERPQDPLLQWMNTIAQQELQQRAAAISAIHTVAEAEQRKQAVRTKLLDILGGLPDYKGPLNARVTGQLHNDSYTIEKVMYESLPGFYVTANLYRPNVPGRYPAVLLQSGHTQEGKPENQRLAANLAMKGFVVLCFDPIGQGERVQTYSRQLDAPLAGWSVPEHIEMGAQSELIGQGLARYFIWDAMRSLDYLASRPDVDASRIGAAGCSGGGALTTFTGALDPRLKVVIPGCYPSSFQLLFSTFGPDTEMVFPHFLASGLDTADFVELSAPTPWLLQTTETDEFHFSHEGVQLVYEEARKWYALYHAEDKVGFLLGPGSHGMPLVSREAVYQWMIRWLKNGRGDFHEQPVKMYTNHELQVTTSGNVEDEPGSRKLYQLLAADLRNRERPGTIPDLSAELRNLKIPTDGSAPEARVLGESKSDEIRQEHIQFESEPGIWLNATLYIPPSSGRHPAVLMVKGENYFGLMPADQMAGEMAGLGRVVLEMEPRSSSMKNDEGPYTGDWVTDLQANLIGRNLPALRAHDILRGVDLLAARPDVDPKSIRGAARGVDGIWLLLAAATDSRIGEVWLDHTPYSLRAALQNSMTTDLWDAVIPNFVLHWDLNDLVTSMGARQVLWTDPTNWMNRVVSLGPPYQYRYVLGDTTDLAHAQDDAYIHELLQ
jgi:cephalosporin-C deacetylase-like acetyl esterase